MTYGNPIHWCFFAVAIFAVAIWPVTGQFKIFKTYAQRKPNARLEMYKAFQDSLTFLNRHMIVWFSWIFLRFAKFTENIGLPVI